MGKIELLVCAECAAKNTIDGAFCRQCGVLLPEITRDEMKLEAEKLLIDGRQLLNDGRTQEAGLVADSVLEIDPSNANALALRGDIFERDGLFAEALETYERVMEVRPDNAMDRIRVAHLSKLVAAEEIAIEEPVSNRRGILLVAAAGVLLASVGAALFIAANSSQSNIPDNLLVKNESGTGFTNLDPTIVPITPNGVNNINSGGGQQTDLGTTNVTGGQGTGSATYSPSNPNSGYSRPVQSGIGQGGIAPFTPEGPKLQDWPNTAGVSNTRPNPGPTQPENPNPVDNGSAEEANPPKEDPGVVEIRVKPGSENSNPGAESGGAMSAEQLIQKARNLYIQENYAGAAEAYEAAIRAGAGSGATYQRLAQCYEKMGRKSDAIRSYRNAVRAFDSQISRGNGSDSVRAAKESCERAISALGG